jgi:lipase
MQLHLHEWGDPGAPPLVCLHGISGHAGHFRQLAEGRLASRYHVLAPDLRGHGESAHDPPWNIATHLGDVRETIGDAGVDHVPWIGMSFGGRLVLELAAREPHLVERAVLLDPAIQILPHVGHDMAEDAWRHNSFESIEAAVDSRLARGPATPRSYVERDRGDQLVRASDGRYYFRFCVSAVVTGYGELTTEPPPPETLEVPTLLVYAPDFGLVREEQVQSYKAALGDLLTVVPVPGGHVVVWDAYEQTADAVDSFL